MPPHAPIHRLLNSLRHTTQKIPPELRRTARTLFLFSTWIPIIICFNDSIGELAPVKGPSMYPYLNEGFDRSLERDVCWVDKVGWFKGAPSGEGEKGGLEKEVGEKGRKEYEGLRRGMIVSLLSPTRPEIHSIKRIIGLPGDTIQTRSPYPEPSVTIPAGHIWVEGDGREHGKQSLDSNYYGPVAVNLVQGTLTWVVWPWRNWGRVRWWEFRGRKGVFGEGGGGVEG